MRNDSIASTYEVNDVMLHENSATILAQAKLRNRPDICIAHAQKNLRQLKGEHKGGIGNTEHTRGWRKCSLNSTVAVRR